MNALARTDALRPTKPCLPATLRPLLHGSLDYRYRDGDVFTFESSNWQPPVVGGAVLAEIRDQQIPALKEFLAPADAKRISARVVALLGHYFAVDAPAALHQAMGADWVEALSPYPFWAINQAARGWLRAQSKRPTIAAIVAECEDLTRDAQLELRALARLVETSQRQQPGEAA